jgi:hypothetical protein
MPRPRIGDLTGAFGDLTGAFGDLGTFLPTRGGSSLCR